MVVSNAPVTGLPKGGGEVSAIPTEINSHIDRDAIDQQELGSLNLYLVLEIQNSFFKVKEKLVNFKYR